MNHSLRRLALAALRLAQGAHEAHLYPDLTHVCATLFAGEEAVAELALRSIEIAGFGAIQRQLIRQRLGHLRAIGVARERSDAVSRGTAQNAERLIEPGIEDRIRSINPKAFFEYLCRLFRLAIDV